MTSATLVLRLTVQQQAVRVRRRVTEQDTKAASDTSSSAYDGDDSDCDNDNANYDDDNYHHHYLNYDDHDGSTVLPSNAPPPIATILSAEAQYYGLPRSKRWIWRFLQ